MIRTNGSQFSQSGRFCAPLRYFRATVFIFFSDF